MADVDVGMDKADLKKLLMRSKKEPVNCGLGMTKDGVIIKLDKIKQPKALVKDLEKDHKDMKSPHWGQAFVDTEVDAKLVILTLNKAAPGMARKMKKTLKGTGFSKVEIRLEDGSVAEKVGEEDEEDAAEAGTGSAQPSPTDAVAPAAPADAAAEAPAEASAAPAPADAPPQPASEAPTSPDAGALTRQLTDLVRQMIPALAADPSQSTLLKGLAATAQSGLKSGDLQSAQTAITSLQQALGQSGAAPAQAAGPTAQNGATQAAPNMAALGKAKVAWVATRQRVESELDKLHAEMTKVYKGHGFAADLDQVFRTKVEPVLGTLDHSLSDKLEEVEKNTDGAQHAKLVQEARQIIAGYEKYIASEPLIAKLDDNPFVPLAIQKTLTATLAALSKAVV